MIIILFFRDLIQLNIIYYIFFIDYHKFITIVTFLYECCNLHSYQFDKGTSIWTNHQVCEFLASLRFLDK